MDLNQALINYGLDFLRKKGYKKIQAPFLMKKEIMAQTAQLEEFDEALYKVSCSMTRGGSQLTIRSLAIQTTNISLRLPNNRSQACTRMSSSSPKHCRSGRHLCRVSRTGLIVEIRRVLDMFPERSRLPRQRHMGHLPCPSI